MEEWISELNDQQRLAAIVGIVAIVLAFGFAFLPHDAAVGQAGEISCPAPILDLLGAESPDDGRRRNYCHSGSRVLTSLFLSGLAAGATWIAINVLDRDQ